MLGGGAAKGPNALFCTAVVALELQGDALLGPVTSGTYAGAPACLQRRGLTSQARTAAVALPWLARG
eukprot:CAMPEP_0171130550 /NCGR_PEP_ID=MMETSP0766_2-20121228/121115_1 /TAXON_ID=439317 /ORGANISM="Gambierdiscus australes, Strain CAWD 149" /LENGTH=66 /DNA_ID=CAMNT_0011593803 /DNA_START=1 /DNA_END=202 /DNA_ORIENTATION=+